MELLPSSSATRPRLACEVRSTDVVAARSESAAGEMQTVGRATLPGGVLAPSLRAGNLADPGALTQAIRQALDGAATQHSDRRRYATLLLPAAAVRVLLIDFDALPAKPAEALPVVRFRLRKLLPFDVEQAAVSYQQMPSQTGQVSVLAVATPREVLLEYETAVTRAGYLPGAVLPATLACLAGWDGAAPLLLVCTDPETVTTVIVRGGVVLLHRTVELGESSGAVGDGSAWNGAEVHGGELTWSAAGRATAVHDVLETAAALAETAAMLEPDAMMLRAAPELAVASLHTTPAASRSREIAQAVSVAAAYFEDTLRMPVEEIVAAGTVSAAALQRLLDENGVQSVRVREMLEISATAAVASVDAHGRGLLAGVRGALRG